MAPSAAGSGNMLRFERANCCLRNSSIYTAGSRSKASSSIPKSSSSHRPQRRNRYRSRRHHVLGAPQSACPRITADRQEPAKQHRPSKRAEYAPRLAKIERMAGARVRGHQYVLTGSLRPLNCIDERDLLARENLGNGLSKLIPAGLAARKHSANKYRITELEVLGVRFANKFEVTHDQARLGRNASSGNAFATSRRSGS